jgi:amino acid transporter
MVQSAVSSPTEVHQPRRELSLLDTTSIIVGIIIGSAIYEISPLVVRAAGGWAVGLSLRLHEASGWPPPSESALSGAALAGVIGVWLIGGLVALAGALCYAELATAYPQAGGTYVFLSEGLGRSLGFAFAWCEFWIVRPGNVGAVAFVLARYAVQLLPADMVRGRTHAELSIALSCIAALALLNAFGLRAGKWTQNVLTAAKIAGLLALIAAGFISHAPAAASSAAPSLASLAGSANVSLALILIMFAYGGWADMSFVAAEVREPGRNIFRALLLGTGAVVVLYLAANVAFAWALGIRGLAEAKAAAAEVFSLQFGAVGGRIISLLVVVSCLGAINGMLLAGSRVFYALGTHHAIFGWLGQWKETTSVPLRSLALQTAITLALVTVFGLQEGGFSKLVVFTGPFYWLFIGLVGIALIVLRRRGTSGASGGGASGGFRVPLYPLSPLVFWLTSTAMAVAAIRYAAGQVSASLVQDGTFDVGWLLGTAWAGLVVLSGLVVGVIDFVARRRR